MTIFLSCISQNESPLESNHGLFLSRNKYIVSLKEIIHGYLKIKWKRDEKNQWELQ